MKDIYKKIRECSGKNDCYGKLNKLITNNIRPVAFKGNPNKNKVMIITEQPKQYFNTDNKQDLKSIFSNKSGVPNRLKQLLGDEFYNDIINKNRLFYWTHFIKCPGKFRSLAKELKDKGYRNNKLNITKCADTFLIQEIMISKPSMIISVGGQCSSWIIKKFKSSLSFQDDDWRSHIYRQISENKVTNIILDSKKIFILFLLHPSERSGIGWFIDSKMFKEKNLLEFVNKN